MTRQTVRLDEVVDPFAARILVESGVGGRREARFDLATLPRIEQLLLGRPVAEVPGLVQRLCGICPVTHHLAGMRALDQLGGFGELPPTARAVRRLLHFGSVLDAVAPKFFGDDPAAAVALKRFGKAVLTAAGCAGHFPDVAVPGGVRAAADLRLVAEVAGQVPGSLAVAAGLVESMLGRTEPVPKAFPGLILTTEGEWDPLGDVLRHPAGEFAASDWADVVVEEHPGESSPRPYLRLSGAKSRYRVGPMAWAASAPSSGSGQVAQYLGRWSGGARAALALQLLVAVFEVEKLVADPVLVGGEIQARPGLSSGVGVGVVDGPRGLLVHRYVVVEGLLVDCQILTPTAQNEPWLGEMLSSALDSAEEYRELEDAIRAADPCLPCSSAPPGQMSLSIEGV